MNSSEQYRLNRGSAWANPYRARVFCPRYLYTRHTALIHPAQRSAGPNSADIVTFYRTVRTTRKVGTDYRITEIFSDAAIYIFNYHLKPALNA